MAADLAMLDAVAAGGPPGVAALPLGPSGTVARSLPARGRRRSRRVPRPSGSKWCAGPPAGGHSCTAPTSPTPPPSRSPRVTPGGSTRPLRVARGRPDRRPRPPRGARWVARNGEVAAGPVCLLAGQQGVDLRVGERKLCGSAQVRPRPHGPPARLGAAAPSALRRAGSRARPARGPPPRGGASPPPHDDGHARGARCAHRPHRRG